MSAGDLTVSYGLVQEAWDGFKDYLKGAIVAGGARRVCDLGGGANPAVDERFILDHDLEYTMIDSSADELAKAPANYRKVVADLASPSFEPEQTYDFAVSIMVAEHILDPAAFHANIRRLLVPGGRAFHFFPTLYALPFVVNRLLPEPATVVLTRLAQGSGRSPEGREGKFPAFYRWCRGPTRRQVQRLESTGLDVLEYRGYFGHGYYEKLPPAQWLEDRKADWLVRHPVPQLTSFAWVLLARPE
jgi:SAM-dependent methyltransferase